MLFIVEIDWGSKPKLWPEGADTGIRQISGILRNVGFKNLTYMKGRLKGCFQTAFRVSPQGLMSIAALCTTLR